MPLFFQVAATVKIWSNSEHFENATDILRNNKSSNDVPPEFLKAAAHCEKFLDVFKLLTDEIWSTRSVPSSWGQGRLEALFKGKGSKADPSKYRGLNVGSCIAKVIISIILSRLFVWYNKQLTQHQFGFRASRSTSDGILVLKRIQQIMARRQLPVYFLYVDLSAAFDHIVREWLWDIVRLRFPVDSDMTLIDILQSLYYFLY